MRVTSWNMDFHGHRRLHEEAWRYLMEVLAPDLALVQEAVPPRWVRDEFAVVGGTRTERLAWGSAVVARVMTLTPLFIDSSRGSVVLTEVGAPDGSTFRVANVHAAIIKGRVIPALTETFHALRPFLEDRRFVVGGDLNTVRSMEQVWPGNGHGEFWREIDRDFFDCHWQLHHREQITIWRARNERQFQDDHILVDLETGRSGKVKSCAVVDNSEVRRLSDHGPIQVELDF